MLSDAAPNSRFLFRALSLDSKLSKSFHDLASLSEREYTDSKLNNVQKRKLRQYLTRPK